MRGLFQGEDDCDIELFCSGLGAPADDLGLPVTRACRRFCTEDEMCDEGQRCITLIPDPRTGLCVPSGCVLFDDSCPTNTACDTYPHFDSVNFVGACRAIGSVGPGGDCGSNECAAGNRCYAINPGVFRCFPLCDENHLCETGTCQLFPGMPNLAGICLG